MDSKADTKKNINPPSLHECEEYTLQNTHNVIQTITPTRVLSNSIQSTDTDIKAGRNDKDPLEGVSVLASSLSLVGSTFFFLLVTCCSPLLHLLAARSTSRRNSLSLLRSIRLTWLASHARRSIQACSNRRFRSSTHSMILPLRTLTPTNNIHKGGAGLWPTLVWSVNCSVCDKDVRLHLLESKGA